MKRVLIVSPHFPPINAPDHQRIRMSLPYFRDFGWEPIVLAVDPCEIEGMQDALLSESVPADIEVVRVGAMPIRYTRPIGFGSVALRALPYLAKAGGRLIEAKRFDLAYFSTTMFATMALGRKWKEQFNLPYILDFQDPWLSGYKYDAGKTPPGGQFKYRFAQSIARTLEPYAVCSADHIISVSPAYPEVLRRRYAKISGTPFTVLPFGAPEFDFEFVRGGRGEQSIFDPCDGKRHFVYVGRGGDDMRRSLGILFGAIRNLRAASAADWQNTRFHFIGTSYAPGDRAEKSIEPIAEHYGLLDIVEEHVHRIGYHAAIRALLDSDAILLIGSDDPGYTASKLYPCILAKRPVVAVFHESSSVVEIMKECNPGPAVTFGASRDDKVAISEAEGAMAWLNTLSREFEPETNWPAFAQYTAREMTRRQCEIFDRVAAAHAQAAAIS